MPYDKEAASGDSLIWLENSGVLKKFKEAILYKQEAELVDPPRIKVPRRNWWPRRVIAIDGSNIIQRVNNGFPGAEAGLLMISVVAIKLDQLRDVGKGDIPSPSFFRNMEKAATVEAAVPGIGVVRESVPNDTPIDFFRSAVYDTLSGSIADNHESLADTLNAICESRGFSSRMECPVEDCEERYCRKRGEYACECGKREKMYETDVLRLHEYFDGVRTGGEALGRLRSAVEILVLLNVLRFFAEKRPEYLKDCAFVLDGPLAIFGTPASILRPIREELMRLNEIARKANGTDIVLFGIEKSGQFCDHLQQLDWLDDKGQGTRFDSQTVIVPDNDYIHKNIVPPGKTAKPKPFGSGTHFGRFVLYKTSKGEHVVLNTAMLNKPAADFSKNSLECYPRLGDILDVMDQLGTYLYRDGFMPLVRAHANAAIPFKRGSDIIKSLFDD